MELRRFLNCRRKTNRVLIVSESNEQVEIESDYLVNDIDGYTTWIFDSDSQMKHWMAHFAIPKIEGGEGEQKQSENNVDCNCLRRECGPRRVDTLSIGAALQRWCSGKISETRHSL